MKKETKKAPTIRFQGFTDDWEQRKFSELFKRRMERNNGQFDKTKWISVANMYYQDPDKVTSNNIDTRTYVLRLGDISFEGHSNKEFKIGRFVENDIGDGVISELFPIYRHITSYDLNFWKHYINIENIMFPKLQRCIEVSYTSSNKLSEKFFLKESILVPAILEQKKIGTYLKKIDNLITLHQRKLDQLKKLKKYFLQNMFPTKGEKVPRIRFKGFTGDWKQRKFGEIAEYKKGPFGSALKKDFFIPDSATSVKVYEQQNAINKNWNLSRYYISKEYAQKLKSFEVHAGDIIVSCAGTIGEIYELPAQSRSGIINQALMRIRVDEETVCKDSFKLAFSNMIDSFSREFSNGSAIKNIPPFADLKPMKVLLPNKDEQKIIGDFFTDIDKTITLHQRKLNQLQTMKKFMLQNLFI